MNMPYASLLLLLFAVVRVALGQDAGCDWTSFGTGSADVNAACCSEARGIDTRTILPAVLRVALKTTVAPLFVRSDSLRDCAVNFVLQADEACDRGMPRSCTADCARVYIPFHTRCADFMRSQMPTQLAMFNAIRAECQATLNEEEAYGTYPT